MEAANIEKLIEDNLYDSKIVPELEDFVKSEVKHLQHQMHVQHTHAEFV